MRVGRWTENHERQVFILSLKKDKRIEKEKVAK